MKYGVVLNKNLPLWMDPKCIWNGVHLAYEKKGRWKTLFIFHLLHFCGSRIRKRVFSQTLAAEILNCDFHGRFCLLLLFFILFGQLPETLSCWTALLWAFCELFYFHTGFIFGLGQRFYLQIWVLLGCCVDVFLRLMVKNAWLLKQIDWCLPFDLPLFSMRF